VRLGVEGLGEQQQRTVAWPGQEEQVRSWKLEVGRWKFEA